MSRAGVDGSAFDRFRALVEARSGHRFRDFDEGLVDTCLLAAATTDQDISRQPSRTDLPLDKAGEGGHVPTPIPDRLRRSLTPSGLWQIRSDA